MIAHIMQALIVIILIAFPFAINFNGISLDNHSLNSTAVVDSAIVKHYAQNGSLPEKLDAETLKKLGLDADDIKGMTYKKLEDRKFVLSYADSKDKVNESIHSNTVLPQNMIINSDKIESKPKAFFLEIPDSPNQVVTADVVFPDGSTAVLNEKERKEYPANSKFSVTIHSEIGYYAGEAYPSSGTLTRDIVISVSDAKILTYNLQINPSVTQKIVFDVHNTKDNSDVTLEAGNRMIVGYGSTFKLRSIVPNAGYKLGSVNPSEGTIKLDTTINVTEGVIDKDCKVSVENVKNQTVTCYVYDTNQKNRMITLTNGESGVVGYNSRYEVKVEPNKGYVAGKVNVATIGNVVGDMTVTATPAVKEEEKDPEYPTDIDLGNGWCPIKYYNEKSGSFNDGKIHLTPFPNNEYIPNINAFWIYLEEYPRPSYWVKIPKGIEKILLVVQPIGAGASVSMSVKSFNEVFWFYNWNSEEDMKLPPTNMKPEPGSFDWWLNWEKNGIKPWPLVGWPYYIKVTPDKYYKISPVGSGLCGLYYHREYQDKPYKNIDLNGLSSEKVVIHP